MKPISKYEIQFSGLPLGIHDFEWDLESVFFVERESVEIEGARLKAVVTLTKETRVMILQFIITGELKTICDHCGDELWIDIQTENELHVRFSDETDLSGDEVIYLGTHEYKIDISQYLYEFAFLGLPVKKLHQPGECNPEVERYFELEEGDKKKEKEKDPRWEALEKLKNKV